MNVLNIEHIHKIYGDKIIFDDVSCGIQEGDKIGSSALTARENRRF